MIDGDAIHSVAFWGSIALIVIVPTLIVHWYKIRKEELSAGLKQQMIDRGFSAEEILAVINDNPKHLRNGKSDKRAMARV